ncbi:probable G-protein coupled receptor 139 [Scyliorhinus canicula]|uniref:probable G-protein coupled receptor 139 n=1 Tax=Scyliorhinus canicula TaxID=7830 RepID=UPI0018F75780|nr:probable G-protein coupled receptor 139 [Scyliorhinus canicula]
MHGQITGVVYAIYYPILAAIGVPVNLVAIVVLSRGRCGLSKCITRYLVSMAVTDLLVVLTAVIFNRIIGIYFPVSFMSLTPACTLSTVIIYAATESSVWLTVAFTFDRYIAICSQKLKTNYCTEKIAAVVIGTVCLLSCFKSIPSYFIYEPLYIMNNVPWLCNIKSSFYTSLAWTAYDWFARVLNPGLPFLLILLFNALTVRHILAASRSRRRLRANSSGENQSDPEMLNRRKSIVLLFAISGSFILLWMTYVVDFLYVKITNESYFGGSNFNDPRFIRQESGNMLQLLSCCTNTCIYAVTQRKFREELRNAAKYLGNLIVNVVK